MKRCAITYALINDKENYSQEGLRLLSPRLKDLKPLELSARDLRMEAVARAGKMSIQGMQLKLSAKLNIEENKFEIVDQFGEYILKPQSEYYEELPENEAVTMSMADMIGIEVPVHGLVYSKDGSMTYFIKRFDRINKNKKIAVEDFTQLSGLNRDTKYEGSIEKIIKNIGKYCSFPKVEAVKFFKLSLFSFLVGNEDMHLKNFSLINRNNIVMLSPAYDLLNTTIVLKNSKEELALSLNGKKNNLQRNDFFKYLAIDQLNLNENVIHQVRQEFIENIPKWKMLVGDSFLSRLMQEKYLSLLTQRVERLGL